MSIQVLPEEVAAKIAAGEVIERPMSVVKELLENAIDAGATDIRVEIREGGIRLIRVVDNGCGIPASETETAFMRHATSKLRTPDDLDRIATLGFRGEALASIAAVSQITLLTRTASEDVGTRLRMEGGQIVQRSGQGSPVGSSLTVENLFYNIPARRKFLRQPATEAAHIQTLVMRHALAWPALRLSLQRDGKLTFQSSGDGEIMDVILKVYDLERSRQLLEFHNEESGIKAWGYTSLPALLRADRTQLNIFVNRRWVQDRLLMRAILEAYHGLLPSGRFPVTILHVELDPSEIDVNVHPTKAEIRFRNSNSVFSTVQRGIRQSLSDANPVRVLGALPQAPPAPVPSQGHLGWDARPQPFWGRQALDIQRTGDDTGVRPFSGDVDRDADEAAHAWPGVPPVAGAEPAQRNLPPLRILGQLSQTFIIAEGPGGLYLIDQHTAHERVLYERFMSERVRAAAQQQLLTPLSVDLAPLQAAALLDNGDTVASLGFEIEPFGTETVLVRAIPAMLSISEIASTLTELANAVLSGERGENLFEDALLTVVCHSAVRAGQTLSHEEMRDLIRQLEQTSLPHSCPHGRPIFLHLSTDRLAHAFGRP